MWKKINRKIREWSKERQHQMKINLISTKTTTVLYIQYKTVCNSIHKLKRTILHTWYPRASSRNYFGTSPTNLAT
jgi:hypothetical protein